MSQSQSTQSDDAAQMLAAVQAAQDKAAKQNTAKLRLVRDKVDPVVKQYEVDVEGVWKASEKNLAQIRSHYEQTSAALHTSLYEAQKALVELLESETNEAEVGLKGLLKDDKVMMKKLEGSLDKLRKFAKEEESRFLSTFDTFQNDGNPDLENDNQNLDLGVFDGEVDSRSDDYGRTEGVGKGRGDGDDEEEEEEDDSGGEGDEE